MRWSVSIVAGCMACACLLLAPSMAGVSSDVGPVTGGQQETVTIAVGDYDTAALQRGQELTVAGFGRMLVPGKPNLPGKIVSIAIPPGAEVVGVEYEVGAGTVLPGTYAVPPAPLPRVIGDEDPAAAERAQQMYEENYRSVYGSDDAYPQDAVEFVRTAGYRKYNLVDVRVAPMSYRPQSGQLTYYPEITVHVKYREVANRTAVLVDNLARTEAVARDIVLNYESAQAWYPPAERADRGLHDFVIITLDSLTSSVAPLVTWETTKGRTVEVVTTTWINSNYSGYDLAEKMRNFLRDKYPSGEWGIEDVLLVGHYDDVPMRLCAQDLGYGGPETDFYYAELSLADSASWDSDVDRQWGENTDTIDFYNEINVGRIPWSTPSTVLSICNKSAAYEQSNDPAFKKNILLLGGFFWEDTDNAELMEAKVDQTWMGDWSITRMYEQNSTVYSTFPCDYELTRTNCVNVWSNGTYAFVNWAGHGSPTSAHIMGYSSAAFIASSDCSSLNDSYPAIIFADACSNSDTDYTNIGQAMLQRGAVGFLGATKVALGCPGWNDPYDGSSQSLDYFFTTYVTSGNYTQGQAHQQALRNMYTYGLWSYNKYETFEWGAIWGNPNLAMGEVAPPILTINFPNGLPENLMPGSPTTFTVEILDGEENYVPGSGMLYYRYDGGTYLSAPLVHDTGDYYDATLPAASCTDTPEFYISAQGDGSTTVTSPAGAPGTVYTAGVGEFIVVLDDNFETDTGWTAENLGASSGDWERGTPVSSPTWDYDPESDSDGSGQCYVTENYAGNSDVDGGAVRLISPIMDMSGGGVTISYDYFLRLTDTAGGVDMLLVEIDSNGGAGPWTEIARHDTDGGLSWRSHTITQADLNTAGVTMSATMQMRFTTNDADPQSVNESGLDAFLVSSFNCTEQEYDLGDLNCDGVVNNFDIDPFVLVITSTPPSYPEYYAAYPECDHMLADCNADGSVNNFDIDPFVDLLN